MDVWEFPCTRRVGLSFLRFPDESELVHRREDPKTSADTGSPDSGLGRDGESFRVTCPRGVPSVQGGRRGSEGIRRGRRGSEGVVLPTWTRDFYPLRPPGGQTSTVDCRTRVDEVVVVAHDKGSESKGSTLRFYYFQMVLQYAHFPVPVRRETCGSPHRGS